MNELLDYLRTHDRISIKATPNSSINKISGFTDGVLEVKIKAPPENGKANKELLKFLKKKFGKDFFLISGGSGRKKILGHK